jgi:hypothetical protein
VVYRRVAVLVLDSDSQRWLTFASSVDLPCLTARVPFVAFVIGSSEWLNG